MNPRNLPALLLYACTVLAVLLLGACSAPYGPPDPFDQALGNVMAMRAANFQAQAMRAERSAR